MPTATLPPLRLDARSLSRAWWRLPLTMTAVLIGLAYTVAFLIGAPGLGGWWPLTIAGGIAAMGMQRGRYYNGQVAGMLGQRAGVDYLPADHGLAQRVHRLADRMGLPRPKVGIMRAMNAYASGPSPQAAVVVLGLPLVQRLTSDELDAVIGHELGHIATGDVRRMQYGEGFQHVFDSFMNTATVSITAGVRSAVRDRQSAQLVGLGGRFVNYVGRRTLGFGSELVLKASSREREFHADAIGAALTSPAAMIGALEKLSRADAPPTAAESDFAYMMFRGPGGSLWATHPTLDQRRAALEGRTYIRKLPQLQEGNFEAWPEGY